MKIEEIKQYLRDDVEISETALLDAKRQIVLTGVTLQDGKAVLTYRSVKQPKVVEGAIQPTQRRARR